MRLTYCPHCGKNPDEDYCDNCHDAIATEQCCDKNWCRDCMNEHTDEAHPYTDESPEDSLAVRARSAALRRRALGRRA